MNFKLLLPSFYFKNYHSFVLLNSIIFIIMSIPFPDVNDWSLKGMRYMLELPIILILSLLALSNFILYSKSFISKTYPYIQDTISDYYNVSSVYIVIVFKFLFHLLSISFYINDKNIIKIPSPELMLSMMSMIYILYLVGVMYFTYRSIKGTYTRYTVPINKNHWITKFLTPKQIRKIKNISMNGEIVSVYFNGFHLDESDNSVIIRKHKLKLNAFRDYITLNNLKVDDLTDEELTVIEMLGI